MIFAAIVGIANYAIYMATIDYMICAYGPYSASATGGNGWARDFLAGVLTVPALPFFENIGRSQGRNLEYASTILFCISFVLVIAVYVIYWKGPQLRKQSPFAQRLANAREGQAADGRQGSVSDDPERPGEFRRRLLQHRPNANPARLPVSSAASGTMHFERRYSQQHRFFGESRVTPRGTPRGTPAASRRPSLANTGKK
ncbi:hypothetical protein OCS_00389 [Ophiocordyceps sinensis CO18]|uniref:Uncharacterized protein n=1 Tax=Ophiocordyceps sinensis (strain Co18 / CGMCC 3.14243) TaxID=911162 RepID=T5AN91_OPHSC|nr:hypothetical protein OCS_00389 [Ophiocordyceps sinensis CO18]